MCVCVCVEGVQRGAHAGDEEGARELAGQERGRKWGEH